MTHAKAVAYDLRARTFWSLVAIMLGLVAVYVFLIASTTANTVARKHLEADIVQLSLKHASLEFAYIREKNKLDLALAQSYGLAESKPVYVSRVTPRALSLSTVSR